MSFLRQPTITPATSAPVIIARTPESLLALLVSMPRIRAWGKDARRIFADNAAGTGISAAQRVLPETFSAPSILGTGLLRFFNAVLRLRTEWGTGVME